MLNTDMIKNVFIEYYQLCNGYMSAPWPLNPQKYVSNHLYNNLLNKSELNAHLGECRFQYAPGMLVLGGVHVKSRRRELTQKESHSSGQTQFEGGNPGWPQIR